MKDKKRTLPTGNKHKTRNALKEGFFAQELVISEQEKPEFDELRKLLLTELAPETPLQHVAFGDVVHCCWRCRKVAPRLEARMLAPLLSEPAREAPAELPSDENPVMRQWWGTNRETLRAGIKLLAALLRDVESDGRVREDWKESLIKGFGLQFFEDLTKWTLPNYDAVLLAQHLVQHAKVFKKPLPEIARSGKEVILDPFQQKEMTEKLIRQMMGFLETIRTMSDRKGTVFSEDHNANLIEAASRYSTSAMRDMHRAIKFYLDLKKNRL